MAKSRSAKRNKRTSKKAQRRTEKALRSLEQRLDALEQDHRSLGKRMKKLTRRLEQLTKALPDPAAFAAGLGEVPFRVPFPGPPTWFRGFPDGPGGRGRPRGPRGLRGGPWGKGVGPVVSLEVPLETNDPSAPLWATVSARLPEEITTVEDDGSTVRYRYSPAGSTPTAPRYRRIREDRESFPG